VHGASIKRIVRRKLQALDSAIEVSDLKAPPDNRLEALKGNLTGYYSIRVNDQWRLIFKWSAKDKGPINVDIVDCH